MCNTLAFYNKNLEIIKRLNSLLFRHIITNEVNSLLIFGDQNESNLISITEKIKLINLILEVTQNKIPILTGIFSNLVDDAIEQVDLLGKKFENINFMLSPPVSEKKDNDIIKSFFENIFDSVNHNNQIYLINNPSQFAGNEIKPELLKDLMVYENFKGLNDSFYNIKICKSYIQYLDNNFSVFCGMEENSQTFLQLIPLHLRKFSGIVTHISNLVNLSSKLYKSALEDNILDLLQIQERINDVRKMIYQINSNNGNELIGLKYAFLYLYRDIISKSDNNINLLSEDLHNQITPIGIEKIEAIVNSLLQNKQIYRLYSIGRGEMYQFNEVIKTFSNIDVLVNQGKVKTIKEPYITDINTISRVIFEKNQLVFRFRTGQSLQIENLIKEKLLYPFLDKSLNPQDLNLRENVKEIINTQTGSYLFHKEQPPIIPVCNLFYYDETKEIIPYLFSVTEYIRGKPLNHLINQYNSEGKSLNTNKFLNLFSELGNHYGKLHTINFPAFYNNLFNIGQESKISYNKFLEYEFEQKIRKAKKNQIDFCDEIRNFYRDNNTLIEEETEYVLLHNNFQSQSIVVKEESGLINIKGIVDFDYWGIGCRAQEFSKFDYWISKSMNNPLLSKAFYDAYSKFYKVNNDFKKKIELFKLIWLLDKYNLEYDLIKKSDQKELIKTLKLSLENSIDEMKVIIR
ncbi:MAG: dihydrodipicolinate synthase family protein [Promethearchaeota archaeon]